MIPATLVWFDVSSGEGVVQRDSDGELLYLHFSCITSIDKNRYTAPTGADQARLHALKSGAPCLITVYRNLYSERVETAEFDLPAHTPTTLPAPSPAA